MNRRHFCQTIASVFSLGAVATANEVAEELPTETGPFCVEIYSPDEHKHRSLPLFDNMKQARNMAQARMNIMKNDTHSPSRTGKILITKPNGSVCECLTWGHNWSQTISYVNCSEDRWRV